MAVLDYEICPRNGRACLPRGARAGARQKPAPRIGVQQQVKTKPKPSTFGVVAGEELQIHSRLGVLFASWACCDGLYSIIYLIAY
jgi:hypothetical protein